MKKILALIMVLALVMGMAVTASAADNYSITITPADGIERVTYKVYKVFNAVPGENGTISYTLVSGKTTAPAGFTVDAAGNVSYTGTGADGELTAADINAIKGYVTAADLVATVNVTNGDPVVVSLAQPGYYYIATTNGAVVAVDSTNPTAAVTDKNAVPTLVKSIVKVNGTAITPATSYVANVGDVITFRLSITIPATTPLGTTIDVRDAMDAGLLRLGTLYTFYTDLGFSGSQHWQGTKADSLNMSADLLGTLTVNENNSGKTINLEYNARLEEDAVIGGAGNKNEAWLVSSDFTSEKAEATVYTYAFTLKKIDDQGNPLDGATFVLSRSQTAPGQENDVTVNFIPFEESSGVLNVYKNASTAADYRAKAYFTAGTVEIRGIAPGTYYLHETAAPAGYNKLTAPVVISIAQDGTVSVDGAAVADRIVEVENNSGSELPSTGGIGTTLFYVIGTLMMTGAAVLMITKKRMSV
ncbi:MAG: isopeptide-forming domain-containing fimbrial protein [Oscillospiraceae bacterium]|nr:isopeptide-forming domain-containing fimbrial protein [Oscillospiraceae bacterium]